MEIIWSDLAVQQLDEIAEYVQDNYGEFTSRKMVHKITEYVNRLKVYPSIGKPDFDFFSKQSNSDLQVRHLQVFPNLIYSSFGSKNSVLYAVCASWLSNAILRLSAMTCLSTVSSSHSSISATMQTTSSIASQMQSMTVISLNPRYVSLNRPPIVS